MMKLNLTQFTQSRERRKMYPIFSKRTAGLFFCLVLASLANLIGAEVTRAMFPSEMADASYQKGTLTPTPEPKIEANRSVRLPILMYHRVDNLPANADSIRQGLTVKIEDFREQLAYLRSRGYQSVSLNDLYEALTEGRQLPSLPVIFTFDDGYADNFEKAYPMMKEFGFRGTIFLATAFIEANNPDYLSWPQLSLLLREGWKVEPHGHRHIGLKAQTEEIQRFEINRSIQVIKDRLGIETSFFNYPSGSYDETTVRLVREAGLKGAVTTSFGLKHDAPSLDTLRRVRVNGRGSFADFRNSLESGKN